MGTRTLDAQKESASDASLIVIPTIRRVEQASGGRGYPGRSALCVQDGVTVHGHRWRVWAPPWLQGKRQYVCERCHGVAVA